MDINITDIGNRIKNRRKELGLTQTDIYQECGIASGALSQIENGNRTPSAIAFYKLSQVLNCNMEWLITGIATSMQSFIISESEEKLLNNYRELTQEDQDELIAILQMKLQKIQNKRNSNSRLSNRDNMAG